MKNHLLAFPLLFSILLTSCKKDDDPSPQGCCGQPAIEKEFGNAYAYIPNVFTPDQDGINDLLNVQGDSISRIESLLIKNSNGVTVFEVSNLNHPNEQADWDGSTEGFIIPGLYEVTAILMSDNGIVQTLTGYVCNFPCGSASFAPIEDITQCQFPVQWDGNFNPLIPSGEQPSCFE